LASAERKMFSTKDGLLKLSLESISRLKLHEQVLPEFLKNLKKTLLDDKVVRDPVMVDERTLVVLDGMHRVVALRELGYSYVPCCLIDYMLPSIKLGAWYRVVTGNMSITDIVKLTRASFKDFRLTDVKTNDVDKMVKEGQGISAFESQKSAWLMTTGTELNHKEEYDLIYKVEEKLRAKNLKISYHTESDAMTIILQDNSATSIIVPTLTKQDVIYFSSKGEVFAPKATRHVFPTRILGVNAPLEILKGRKMKMNEANEKFQTFLSKRRLLDLPSGQIIDGRRYEEPLYAFKD
jgi:hypothetical protein